MKNILAIVAILVAIAAAVWFLRPRPASPDEVFAQLHQPRTEMTKKILADLESMGMAGAANYLDSLRTAIQMLENGQVDGAIELLNVITATRPNDHTAQFYLGTAFLEKGLYARAIAIFTPLVADNASEMNTAATWSLALCYLKQKNGEKQARQLFVKLSKNPDPAINQSAHEALSMLR